MIEITDRNHKPSLSELQESIANPLFGEFYDYLAEEYKALCSIEYSGDKLLLGWNIKLYKSGRTLCRIYPSCGSFRVLVVVGRKEKERVEAVLPQMSDTMQNIYANTKEGMGQRWLLIQLTSADSTYHDVLHLIQIRRES